MKDGYVGHGLTEFRTISGRYVDLLDPDPDNILIEDVAHALARICRYNGHISQHYSVAQHSVLASYVGAGRAREKLMHDAPEALVGDLTRALKNVDAVSAPFHVVERRVHRVMAAKFGYEAEQHPDVKLADDRMAVTELRDLFTPPRESRLVALGVVPLLDRIYPWQAEWAAQAFLDRFHELFG